MNDGYDIDPPEYDPQAALAAAGFAWAADRIERLEKLEAAMIDALTRYSSHNAKL